MAREYAVVIEVESCYVWVKKASSMNCDTCSAKPGCGVSLLESYVLASHNRAQAVNKCRAHVGDTVIVELNDTLLLKLSLITYLLPCFVFVCGCVAGAYIDNMEYGNWFSVLSGVMCLALAVCAVRTYSHLVLRSHRSPLTAVSILH